MTNHVDQDNYRCKTKDLYEAAALYASKARLVEIERDGKQCWFIFDDYRDLSNKYWSRQLQVDAKEYADAIRTLKDRIFAQE